MRPGPLLRILYPFFICLICAIPWAHAGTWVWVDKAVDGDTLRLQDGRLVRYMGINTPEIDHLTHHADPFGWKAHRLNQQLVAGKKVRLEPDMARKDRYGRILADVYDEEGQLVSLLLISKGLCYFYPHPSDAKATDDRLLSAQRNAMKQRSGIWETISRRSGPRIGNRGSRRFHKLQCPLAGAIAPYHIVRFSTPWEAYWQGYAPCDRCLPSPIKKELKHR